MQSVAQLFEDVQAFCGLTSFWIVFGHGSLDGKLEVFSSALPPCRIQNSFFIASAPKRLLEMQSLARQKGGRESSLGSYLGSGILAPSLFMVVILEACR